MYAALREHDPVHGARRDRDDLRFGGGPLEAAFGVDVRSDGFLVDEFQARVDFRRTRQGSGNLPQEQLQGRQEPLQVGLLVDREFDEAFVEQFLGLFGQIEAAGVDAEGIVALPYFQGERTPLWDEKVPSC